jgi:hypothetical protein
MFAIPDIKAALPEFIDIYSRRPLQQNAGGMRFNHSFATWFILKTLKPTTVIESGVWRGQSTWLIEQACPGAQIFCLDIDFSNLVYKSKSAVYLQNDFSYCTWEGVDRASAVCFFDDHQNAYQRLKDVHWAGFKRAIFDDNYPCGEGDCYSLKHMLKGFGHPKLQMSTRFKGSAEQQKEIEKYEAMLRSVGPQQHLLVAPNVEDRVLFQQNCKTYFEFPPVALGEASPTWGTRYEGEYKTETPVFSSAALPPELAVMAKAHPEELEYAYIAYVELK